ncbi:hypothetical protein H9L12_00935 [Sphingomonas rhizophila]|uniref:Lipoprotein n=1 Tax=Sphingomonas rhizophila TaxID=2071607 RepID=A0A7G9SBM2_9SPHN|nr:hypothetical protein [Sphingomonas rhizophila]QNN65247.1 hypothetical protein H9L12_00935 [Sphingomonas rhizophila]
MMVVFRFIIAPLLIQTVGSCGEPPASRNDLPDGFTPKMVEHYERITSHRKPSVELIDAVEAQVARDRCVGDLKRWERLYSFGLDDRREVDETKVLFHYRQAGVYGFKAGRKVTKPAEWVNPDDRDYALAFGSFDRQSGNLVIDFCGQNLPS